MMRNVYATTQPIPIPFVGDAISQVEKENWEVRFVLYVGVVTPRLAVAGSPQQLPAYALIAMKECIEGEEPQFPNLQFGGLK